MRPITKKTRDDAIMICEMDGSGARACADAIGASYDAVTLAQEAMAACVRFGFVDSDDVQFLAWREAGGILRDGWSPGDPVVRRGGGS